MQRQLNPSPRKWAIECGLVGGPAGWFPAEWGLEWVLNAWQPKRQVSSV